MSRFVEIPCGQTIPPDNIHAVSVSIPKLGEVIAYEKNELEIKEKIKSGYPRFITHPLIFKIQKLLHQKHNIDKNKEIVLVSSQMAIVELFGFLGKQFDIIEDRGICGICITKDTSDIKNARLFLQHTGYIPSSRMAEHFLFENGVLLNKFNEDLYSMDNPKGFIKTTLAEAYDLKNRDSISIGICGMNVIFTAFRSLEIIQRKEERNIFIQFGWLYLDTMEILKKFSGNYIFFESITSITELDKFIKANGSRIAAIFAEVTTNPLIQTPNLIRLHKLAKQHDIPVVVDATFGTPYNVDVKPYSDIIIESLTKFASGNADLLMGAIIINELSPWYSEMMKQIPFFLESPFEGDIRRLAHEIKGYENRMKKINQNTFVLIDYFTNCKKIKEIYWPYQEISRDNYLAIQKHSNAAGGVISIVFNEALEKIYDKIKLPKGPSLGTEFTLLMPYVYFAHYDLISTKKGRKYLKSIGIHPDLLRVSVGIENVDSIIGMFEEAL